MVLVYFILFLHIISVICLLVFWHAGRIQSNGALLWIALLVPLWGPLSMYIQMCADEEISPYEVRRMLHKSGLNTRQSWQDGRGKRPVPVAGSVEKEEEKMTEPEMPMGTARDPGPADAEDAAEEQYYSVRRSVQVENDEMRGKVVPIEEALLVNDTKTRRELIVDVLYSDPTEYVTQLYMAKANPDTEVVHYAATALAEIQKEFDLAFQDIAERKSKNPMDSSIDQEYEKCLERYIDSGLLEGDGLIRQLKLYAELLERKLAQEQITARWTLLHKKARTDIRLKDAEALDKDIARMEEGWPGRDAIWQFRLESAMLKKDSEKIQSVIRQMKEKNIFLTSHLREMVRFWETT